MKTLKMAFAAFVLGLAGAAVGVGQTPTTGNTAGTDVLSDRTPAENVAGGSVRQRSPGLVVKQAIAEHQTRNNARVAAQRAGDASVLAPAGLLGGSASSNPLTNLLGNLLGGLTGGSGGLGSLLGGLTGTTGTPTTTPSTTATPPNNITAGPGNLTTGTGSATGTNSNVPSNLTPEAIALLEANGFDVNQLFAQSRDAAADKPDSRAQTAPTTPTTTQQQPKFLVRWADAMLTTLFTALTVGFQSPDFVDRLVQFLSPPAATDASGNTGSTGNNNASDNTDGTPVDVSRDPNSVVFRPLAAPFFLAA